MQMHHASFSSCSVSALQGDATHAAVCWYCMGMPCMLLPPPPFSTHRKHLQDPKRQKLLGLKTKDGKAATDEAVIADLVLKPNTKVMMMGQPEEVIAKTDAEQLAAPEVQVRT